MNNEYEHAFQNQLFLCAYLHGKRVMPLACERVRTCRMRAFTLFLENLWRVTYNDRFLPEKRGDRSLMLFDILKNFHSKLNETKTSLPLKNTCLAFYCSPWIVSIPKVVQTCLKTFSQVLRAATLANQNWRKSRQKGLTNKKSIYIFLQKSNVK